MTPSSRLLRSTLAVLPLALLAACTSSGSHPVSSHSEKIPSAERSTSYSAVPTKSTGTPAAPKVHFANAATDEGVKISPLGHSHHAELGSYAGITDHMKIGRHYTVKFAVSDGDKYSLKGTYGVQVYVKNGSTVCPEQFVAKAPHLYTFSCTFTPNSKKGVLGIRLVDPATGVPSGNDSSQPYRAH